MIFNCFFIFIPGLIVFFFLSLRATRRQLSTTNLPSGGSEGFNQCTEDLVEKRGESRSQCSHGHLCIPTPDSASSIYSPDGYCYTEGGVTTV